MSPEFRLLYQFCLECHRNKATVTFDAIAKELHINCRRGRDRGCLFRVIEKLKKEGFGFETLHGTGYKPCSDEEVVKSEGKIRQNKIRSQATKWKETLQAVDTSKLSQEGIQHYAKNMVKLAAQEYILEPDVERRLEQKASQSASVGRVTGLEYSKHVLVALDELRGIL